MRTVFFTPVVGNLNRSKGVNGTPSKAYTNSVPDQYSMYPGGQHILAYVASHWFSYWPLLHLFSINDLLNPPSAIRFTLLCSLELNQASFSTLGLISE